jgi:tripartite-type tricarboxylate transporter receptor subunit TctC
MLLRSSLLLIMFMMAASGPALAQTSQKAVQIIVPFPPGGSADGIARIIATELGERLGRQAFVENKPGAGGGLGLQILSKSAPDGDTLSIGATGALVINPHVPGSTGFDPVKELAPVAKLIDIPIVLVSNAKTGPKTVKEMLERAKSASGGLSYGTTGANSSQHLAVELIKKMTSANLVHVPYRGSAPAAMAVIGDQIPLASVDLTSGHPHIKAGTLNGLGVTSAKRAEIAPDIPTIAEGGVPGYDGSSGFIGIFAPRGTPPARVRQLSAEISAIVAKPDVQAKILLLSVEPAYEDETAFGKFLAAESAKWRELFKSMPAAK